MSSEAPPATPYLVLRAANKDGRFVGQGHFANPPGFAQRFVP
jgi:hypothetical protein